MKENREIFDVCLVFGANLGDRLASFKAAHTALLPFIEIEAVSAVYQTTPTHVLDQPPFYNAALWGKTKFDPRGMLYTLKDIELDLGRMPSFYHGPRVIDLDIMFYGQEIIQTPELTLPHVSMAERSFFLRPMADIVPNWRHPVLGQTVTELLAALPDKDAPQIVAETF